MATYKQIQQFVKSEYGYSAKSCWIAHCKEIYGLNPSQSTRRIDPNSRKYPCPQEKQLHIKAAFEHFSML
ncbi:hypothetical protein MKY84_01200 [Chryseomicrobium sp. FSL W7-1435]|uniref:hypothetical protein n=1 Tax=Chryseomicrobium sp. FSL W7-1435 TaxID=2921704 RepID=UPI003159D118